VSLLLPVAAIAASGKTECRDDWICVDEVRHGDVVELHARNLRVFPLTYTLEVRTRSFSVEGDRTVTRTLRPLQSEKVMLLTPRDGYQQNRYSMRMDWTIGDKNANHDDDHLYAFPYTA